jgi:hypothetical protein
MKQKFSRLSFIHICKEMPSFMMHYESDFDGIIDGSHSQLHGGKDIHEYAVYQIKEGKIVNRIAWYNESQITLLDKQDRAKAEEMIEEYNFSKGDYSW